MAPVFIGAAAALLGELLEEPLGGALAEAGVGAAPSVAVGVGTPAVRGLSVALDAPVNAGDPADAEGVGVALVALGFKTLLDLSRCPRHGRWKLTCR